MQLVDTNEKSAAHFHKLAVQLETMAAQIRAKEGSIGMVDTIDQITPDMMQQEQDIPVEEVVQNLDRFNTAYDSMAVKGNILEQGMDKTLANPGGQKDLGNMMTDLKKEVQLEEPGLYQQYNMPEQQGIQEGQSQK